MRRQWEWVVTAFAVMVLFGLIGHMRIWPHALEGQRAPDFTAPRHGGGQIRLSDETARILVLEFWSRWCTPCLVTLSRLEKGHQWAEQNRRPVSIYCVNLGDSPGDIAEVWRQERLNMPVLLDPNRHVADRYQAGALPQTVLIADGLVERVFIGSRSVHTNSLRKRIESLLARTPNGRSN